jgi:hypothetical protein
MREVSLLDQLGDNAAGCVGRHGKANARRGTTGADDLRIDANDAAILAKIPTDPRYNTRDGEAVILGAGRIGSITVQTIGSCTT